jgi:drug/metabolite transporter (DMT)-like permease
MTPSERQQRFRVALAFGLVYLLWGSTYLGIRVAVEHIPPALLGGVRFLVGGLPVLAYCALSGRKISLTFGEAWRLCLVGVLLLSGGNVLLAYSEEYVGSGLAALIVAVVPLWVALIEGFILKGDRLRGTGWVGLFLGMAGLVVLLWPQLAPVLHPQSTGSSGLSHMQLFASGVLLLGSLNWSIGSIISRRFQWSIGAFAATGWEMTFAGAVNFIIAVSLGDLHRAQWTPRGIGAVAYLVVFGSWIGFTAYIWLLENVPTPKVATYAYVNPVVAVFLGWLILHEKVDAYILTGALIIVAAVVLVTSSKLKAAKTPGEEVVLDCKVKAEA